MEHFVFVRFSARDQRLLVCASVSSLLVLTLLVGMVCVESFVSAELFSHPQRPV